MKKIIKFSAVFLLFLLTATMLAVTFVSAQDQPIEEIPPEQYPSVPNPNVPPSPPATEEVANVVIAASVGGTTTPNPGAYVYAYGATITLQATPNQGFRFLYWIIKGTYTPGHNQPPVNYPEQAAQDPEFVPKFPSPSQVAEDSLITSTNPLHIICGYGYTYVYEPVFQPTTPPPTTGDAIVTVKESVGGTTTPAAGTYYYSNGTTIHLQATPNAGYDFQYWVAVGEDGHPVTIVDNPTNIICGYGYTYSYQPMFAPAGTTPTTQAAIPIYIYAIIVVLAIIAVVGIVAAVVFRRKH
ncbi:MAG: hypothetical protein NWE98_01170 [Candidatus Bathyarchaeota archaeon]|nr:hypothetical protein [Candidatus Bathyarchaeota archaeon]